MRRILSIFVFLLSFINYAQSKETINWIQNNSIEIEDANPDSNLDIFHQNIPEKFANAKIYGFGEASHNTKEFFDIKAKFFKYLVKNHRVKTFIMEDVYQVESGINEWIRGGKGDVKTIANNFRKGIWYTKEIVNLLQWMRNYNLNKPEEEHIRFYGMDIEAGDHLNREIRAYVKKYQVPVDEKLLAVADSCSNKRIDFRKSDNWWQNQLPKLNQLKQQLLDSDRKKEDHKAVIRSVTYLIQYVEYASTIGSQYPTSTKFRDLQMFKNVKYIVENESENGKAFVWAHNEHINKREMYYSGSNILNLGHHLKEYFKNDYYSVGFDFGSGKIDGFVIDKKNGNHMKTYTIEKPFKKTYAHTLMAGDKDIYFIDLDNAPKFFRKKSKHLLIAAGGYQPKPLHKIMVNKIYAETYDGLIFVKKISRPNYNLD